ncbi:MAG: bifunctional metallophosphatase/5'-nucleotidase [Candidatus Rokuibacteriota bacterium]|nr:MAG: bifunctional metallophosphatase/5'-nucleotidase [Candidatus Rokubacteria bacterium]
MAVARPLLGGAARDRVPDAPRRRRRRRVPDRDHRMTRPFTRAALVLLVVVVLGACATPGERAAGADLVRLTLLQINDHYVLEPVDGGRRGGMARLATLVRDLRRESPNSVFVLAGDTLSPSVESTFLQGAQMIAALNAIGLDFATFGNHEFDFGPSVLVERMNESKFRWLSANVVDRRSGRAFGGASPDVLLTLGGVRVGLFGLTTPDTAHTSRPGSDVVFGQPVALGKDVAARLRARGADLVVAVTHMEMSEDKALAAAAGVDVILGGHEHDPLVAEEGKTLITKSGSDARYLVQVDLWLTRDGRLVERSWRFREVSRRVPPDPTVEALVREYAQRLDRELDVVVGRTAVPLEARTGKVRTQETNLGDFVADVIRERLGSDVAVVNGGAIRTNRAVPPGPLTKRDVHSLLPFTDVVLKLEMRGRDLRMALEHGLTQADREGGGFLQLSGVRLVWDRRLPGGRRIVDATIGDRPLADEAAYTVAVPSYLVRGGDGFTAFARAAVIIGGASGPQVAQLLLDAIAVRGEIAPATDGRITEAAR